MRRLTAALALALLCPAALSPQAPVTGTLVIAVGAEPNAPVPTVGTGRANQDAIDLLFLRLLRLGPDLVTAGDNGFQPELARRWTRRDSLTIAFELDPRARWHDGTPVTTRDVVFAVERARDRAVSPSTALLLRSLNSVSAEGDRTVVFRFSRAYAEQVYDAMWHARPLPAHLLDTIPKERLAASAFVQQPVGNGPYRWDRREPGRQLVLAADPGFFLGRPGIGRVVFLLARDPEAQVNLLLDGTADALELLPLAAVPRVQARSEFRIIAVPTTTVGYLLFNQRGFGDRGIAHPILAERDVRRALVMALDRPQLLRATFGPWATLPEGPVAQLHWVRRQGDPVIRHDPAAAGALLERAGWRDTDGDGIRDRNGQPLSLRFNLPGTSAVRVLAAAQIQEQWRRIGVRAELVRLDGPVWAERRGKGEFDVDFSSATLDPSPSGIFQSWSCAGRAGSNVAQYCSPGVDSLLDRAIAGQGDTRAIWHEAIRRMVDDAPAAFVYAPVNPTAIHTRFERVAIRPEAYWGAVWQWRVRPGRELARDRAP